MAWEHHAHVLFRLLNLTASSSPSSSALLLLRRALLLLHPRLHLRAEGVASPRGHLRLAEGAAPILVLAIATSVAATSTAFRFRFLRRLLLGLRRRLGAQLLDLLR